jgi:hypothetical protein
MGRDTPERFGKSFNISIHASGFCNFIVQYKSNSNLKLNSYSQGKERREPFF